MSYGFENCPPVPVMFVSRKVFVLFELYGSGLPTGLVKNSYGVPTTVAPGMNFRVSYQYHFLRSTMPPRRALMFGAPGFTAAPAAIAEPSAAFVKGLAIFISLFPYARSIEISRFRFMG